MARRPMKIGTYGTIRTVQLSKKPPVFESRARFRMGDGSIARPRRRGPSKTAAEEALKDAMIGLAEEARGAEIGKDTRMAHIAALWLADVQRAVTLGDTAPGTHRLYAGWTKNWIVPKVGQLTARELEQSVMTCEKVITNAEDKASKTTAKGVKAAFGQICGYAVRHGAMTNNPVRSTASIGGTRKKVLALDLPQRLDLLEKLEEFAKKKQVNKQGRKIGNRGRVWRDMPDRFRARLATGVRVGEIIAVCGSDIDTHARTVRIDHHLVHVAGQGVVRMAGRKGGVPNLLLRYPEWSADMWRRLKLASGGGPIFPNASGGWINPNEAPGQESEALEACGYGWVTGHVMRKTVAKVLKDGGQSVEQIADQLGNSPAVVAKHYLESGATNDAQAEALEGMLGEQESGPFPDLRSSEGS